MANNISIKLKKDEVCIELNNEAKYIEIIAELEEKVLDLQKFYKEDKTPIVVTGRELNENEFIKAKEIIKEKIDTEITYERPKTMGLHSIKGVYEQDSELTEAKFIRGSLRSGQKVEHIGSIVILGDVNSGSEIIASENIVVVGALRGIAHAGAKGNKKSFISANCIESPQLRISNVVTSFEKEKSAEVEVSKKTKYAYIKDDTIVIE